MKSILLSLPFFLLLNSCSLILIQGGRNLERLFRPASTAANFHKAMGTPSKTATFKPMKMASEIPEIQKQRQDKTGVRPDECLSGYEDYRFQGWIHDPYESEIFVNVDLLTCGLAGVVGAPDFISTQEGAIHGFRIYYDSSGHYFGHIETEDSITSHQLNRFHFRHAGGSSPRDSF